MRDLKALPKAHLHLHLEGCMRPGTLYELADLHGIPRPEVRGFGSFTAFAGMYVGACEVLRREDDWRRLVEETVLDAVDAGAVWIEPAFYPGHHRARWGDDRAIWEMVISLFEEFGSKHGVGVGMMVSADRQQDPADAVVQARIAASFADRPSVVSFGLANDEVGAPPELFVDAYRIARDAGLLSTPHAGELEGPHFIVDSIELLGADRIEHGVRAFEMPGLVERLAEWGGCLDVCPTSNICLSVFPSLEAHPLPALLEAGVACSVNADDSLLFGPGLLEEYELCRTAMGLSDEQLASVARASIVHSGAPAGLKASALSGIEAWLATA